MKAEKQAVCLLVFYFTLCLSPAWCGEKQERTATENGWGIRPNTDTLYEISKPILTVVGDSMIFEIQFKRGNQSFDTWKWTYSLPCPPCPDTVRFYQPHAHENADSVIYRTSSTWYYNYIPSGRWVKPGLFCQSYRAYFRDSLALVIYGGLPDSVFILHKENKP